MQVYNYYTLSDVRPQATINTVLGIQTAVGQLKTDLVNAATRLGREPQSFSYGTHSKIVIDENNAPGFAEGLRRGNITFFLDVNKNYFQRAVRFAVMSKGSALMHSHCEKGHPFCSGDGGLALLHTYNVGIDMRNSDCSMLMASSHSNSVRRPRQQYAALLLLRRVS